MIKKKKKTQGKPTFYNDMMELIYVKTKKTLILFCFFNAFMNKKLKNKLKVFWFIRVQNQEKLKKNKKTTLSSKPNIL